MTVVVCIYIEREKERDFAESIDMNYLSINVLEIENKIR